MLFGCQVSEPLGDAIPDGEPADGSGYIAFVLTEADAASPTSRGDIHKEYDDDYAHYEWFNRGSAQERAIVDNPECNRVLFFNTDNSYYGQSKLSKAGTGKENVYIGRKPGSLTAELPTQFLIVINGDPTRLDELNESLKTTGTDALKEVLNRLQILDPENPESIAMSDGYFTMTSSIYRAEDDDLIAGVTTKEDFQFYETREEALLPQNLLYFYVERILGKISVRVGDGELSFEKGDAILLQGPTPVKVRTAYQVDEGFDKDIVSTWRANLANWGINGIEKNTYLFKTLEKSPAIYPWTISSDFYPRWSEYRLYRSYWAIDENYYDGIYPDQFRIALDEDGVRSGSVNTVYSDNYDPSEGLVQGDYTLIYRSYNAFGKRADSKYSVENTYDEVVLDGQDMSTRPWLRCGTHVIVTAQLIIDELDKDIDRTKVDEHGFIKGVSDKYFSNGLYWTKTSLVEQATVALVTNVYFNSGEDPIRNVLGTGNVEFIDNDEDNPLHPQTPLVDENGTALSVETANDVFELVPAFIKGGDGWVTIALKKGKQLKALHADGTKADITEEQLVSYIYRFTNLAKHYNEGRMYYALPIRHNVDSKNFENGGLKVSTADYGFVRNHWYRLTINNLMLPGTPVDDPDQPIIPNNEPDDKSLGINIEIIPWHIVDIYVGNLQ